VPIGIVCEPTSIASEPTTLVRDPTAHVRMSMAAVRLDTAVDRVLTPLHASRTAIDSPSTSDVRVTIAVTCSSTPIGSLGLDLARLPGMAARKRVTHLTLTELSILETRVSAQLRKLPPETAFFAGDVRVTAAQVLTLFDTHLAGIKAAQRLLAQWKLVAADNRKLRTRAEAALAAIRTFAALSHGAGSAQYVAYGFTAPKQRKVKLTTKLAALAKGKATRAQNRRPAKRR